MHEVDIRMQMVGLSKEWENENIAQRIRLNISFECLGGGYSFASHCWMTGSIKDDGRVIARHLKVYGEGEIRVKVEKEFYFEDLNWRLTRLE